MQYFFHKLCFLFGFCAAINGAVHLRTSGFYAKKF